MNDGASFKTSCCSFEAEANAQGVLWYIKLSLVAFFVCLTVRVSRPTTACLFPHSLSTVGSWAGTTFDQTPQLISPPAPSWAVALGAKVFKRSLKVFEGCAKVFKKSERGCRHSLQEGGWRSCSEKREKKDRECPRALGLLMQDGSPSPIVCLRLAQRTE